MLVEGVKEAEALNDKKQWYHTRQICWVYYQANVDPKDPRTAKNIDDYWSLDAKSKTKPKPAKFSKAEVESMHKIIQSFNNV